MPLDGLAGAFPTTPRPVLPGLRRERLGGRLDRREQRPRRAVALIRSYADGRQRRRGVQGRARASTRPAFEAAWLADRSGRRRRSATGRCRRRPGRCPRAGPGRPEPERPAVRRCAGAAATPPSNSPVGQPASEPAGLSLAEVAIVGVIAVVLVLGGIALVQRNRRPQAGVARRHGTVDTGVYGPPPEPPSRPGRFRGPCPPRLPLTRLHRTIRGRGPRRLHAPPAPAPAESPETRPPDQPQP